MNDKKKKTIETYNKSAAAMAGKFNSLGARVKDIERLFSFFKNDSPFILEIGCGNGRDAKEILKRTKNYLGIDISEKLIDVAREYDPEGKFEVADVETYNFPKKIDAVVSFASLLHSDKQRVREILEKAHEALASNGIFYISLKEGDYDDEGVTRTDNFGTRIYYFYTAEMIEEMAGNKYTNIFTDQYSLRDQRWFTIILQKK